MEDIVSIVVPVYNVEDYLVQCVESLINQTYLPLQIILVDDGSTDSSGEICDIYSKKHLNVRVIHQLNKGAACAKNAGLDIIEGTYFMFVDADDYIEENAVSLMMKMAEQHHADIVESRFILEYQNRSEPYELLKTNKETYSSLEYLELLLSKWTCSMLCNKLYRSSLTEEIRFPSERICIDDEFYVYRLVINATKIVSIDENLYHYRQRRSGATLNTANGKQIDLDNLAFLPERYVKVTERFPDLKLIYLEDIIYRLIVIIHKNRNDKILIKMVKKMILHYLWISVKSALKCDMNVYKSIIKVLINSFPKDNLNVTSIENEYFN